MPNFGAAEASKPAMIAAKTTIRDVAKKAGVSVGTASKACNNKGKMTEQTRQRILQVAAEMHFSPNALVRSLQSGRTHTVGIFTWSVQVDTMHDIAMSLLKGISDSIAAAGRDMLIYSHSAPEKPVVNAAKFLDGRADGLILGPTNLSSFDLEALAGAGLPTVVLYRRETPAGLGAVTIDNAAGIAAVLDHLVGLGHRRIAFCAPRFTPDYMERYEAICQSRDRHGLERDPQLDVFLSDGSRAEVGLACDALAALSHPPTAIVAGDDSLAFHFIACLTARGLRVPKDISVAGFDDCPAAGTEAGLTTVRQPAEEVGRAAGMLIDRLIGGAAAEKCRVNLPVELVIRRTTASAHLPGD